MLEVPSKIWTTALFPLISSTCPFLTVPSPNLTLTISANLIIIKFLTLGT